MSILSYPGALLSNIYRHPVAWCAAFAVVALGCWGLTSLTADPNPMAPKTDHFGTIMAIAWLGCGATFIIAGERFHKQREVAPLAA